VRLALAVIAAAAGSAAAQTFDFDTPTDDRWVYPFNFSAGTRLTASVFSAAGLDGFNDRDGEIVVRWDTSGQITPGAGGYTIESVTVTLTNDISASWIPDLTSDPWYESDVNGDGTINGDGFPRGDPNDTDGESDDEDPGRPIELYGVGYGPTYTEATWNEFSGYVGSDSLVNAPRDPFPFVYQAGTGDKLHVEDHVKGLNNDTLPVPVTSFTPTPWAYGDPQSYTPGAQGVPFDVVFEVDLNGEGVRDYFEQELDNGAVTVAITSFQEIPVMGSPTAVGNFFMKEGVGVFVGAKAPLLTIVLGQGCGPGDVTTTGAAIGDPGYGVPDGSITTADIQYYVNLYIAGDPGADLTTTGAAIGDPGYGVPDGSITTADIQYYVNLWVAGCP